MAVTRLGQALAALLRGLAAMSVDCAVVGGLAVSARTEPRFTRDADVCVAAAHDAAAEAMRRALQADGYRLQGLVEQTSVGRIATARLVPPDGDAEDVVLDVLSASSGIEAEVVAEAEPLELFEGLTAPVASVPALIALKVLARGRDRRGSPPRA
jgi:predicted nucleotidyltransferase